MGEIKDKVKGLSNEAMGNAKQAVANATGDTRLKAEGKIQEMKGEAQQAIGSLKGALGDKV